MEAKLRASLCVLVVSLLLVWSSHRVVAQSKSLTVSWYNMWSRLLEVIKLLNTVIVIAYGVSSNNIVKYITLFYLK